jgi:predicted dithiol-disulfide oxidoreductase (DUF899 family)
MTEHKIGTREEWRKAREELLEREKELTRRNDELARERCDLPWVRSEKDYSFETEEGTRTLAELFDGRSQLIVYHFMFGPEYEAGCPVCSSSADGFDAVVPHVSGRDVTFLCISRAPLENCRRRSGAWSGTSPRDATKATPRSSGSAATTSTDHADGRRSLRPQSVVEGRPARRSPTYWR